jgi:Ser/Thr protein kinase RdoA (MazF antagonist)
MVDPAATRKSASKKRLRWEDVPAVTKSVVELLAGGRVLAATNCTGGFSPGLASRLAFADGREVFVKGMDAAEWPDQATFYRAEALVSASLPAHVPAPRLLGSSDDGRWVVLVFECIEGSEPDLRRQPEDAFLVAVALDDLAAVLTPAPVAVPSAHPRLGGWTDLAANSDRLARLPALSPWAAANLTTLIDLEAAGLAAALGDSLVHFDAYPHNILLAADRVWFVDWPHARRGAPFIDLILFASAAAAAGIDPEKLLAGRACTAGLEPTAIDAVLAAHAGFCVGGCLWLPATQAFAPVIAAKAELGAAATAWLRRRLERRGI